MNLNYIFAWLSSVGLILLFIIYPLRICIMKIKPNRDSYCMKLNRLLHKLHKSMGLTILALTFIHCKLSSQKFGLNTGTICLLLMIAILCSYLFKRTLKSKWIKIHRELSILLLILLVLHILLTRFLAI